MPTNDQRLAAVEARLDRMNDLYDLVVELRADMSRQFEQMRADTNRQFDQVRSETIGLRADMERRFDQAHTETTGLRGDMERRFDRLERRVDTIDAKADKHFTWLVGLLMTVMLTVIGVLLAASIR